MSSVTCKSFPIVLNRGSGRTDPKQVTVPIPNTELKPFSADRTAWATVFLKIPPWRLPIGGRDGFAVSLAERRGGQGGGINAVSVIPAKAGIHIFKPLTPPLSIGEDKGGGDINSPPFYKRR